MTKIEEIKNRILEQTDDFESCVDRCMVEYAKTYARKVLEIAAREALSIEEPDYQGGYTCTIDPNSILNIKLPEHE